MAITQYFVAATIDGFIADENDRLDWLLQFGFEPFQEGYDEFMRGIGAIVMGATTYEYLLREGERAGERAGDDPGAETVTWAYGALPVWVLTSRELPPVPGADIRFHHGDVGEVHAAALEAAMGRNVWVMGGGKVAAQFADAGQLDELLLTIVPILLGNGKRLLPLSGPTSPLTLMRTTTLPNGALELAYGLCEQHG